MNEEERKLFYSTQLLIWYRQQKRTLPWRENRDPYRIWVSEIMLQQTRVDTVIPYFNRFIDKFPTVDVLASAPEEEVLKCWEGLGYYSRARNLQAGAKMVMHNFNGIIPNDTASVASLKGVGPYTTGAIMSIAFNKPEPAVDGNVMRVLSRFFLLEDDIARPATRVSIEKLAASLIPEGEAGEFNQALMELGALVCTPKAPYCLTCPVMEHCGARIEGRELELPIKTKAKPPRNQWRGSVIIEGKGLQAGKILVRQRPAEGLLAQMWEIPHIQLIDDAGKAWFAEKSAKEQPELAHLLIQMAEAETKLLIRPVAWFMDADHIFSHIHWRMRVYVADFGETAHGTDDLITAESQTSYSLQQNAELPGSYRWISEQDMAELPFPNLFLRILTKYWQEQKHKDIKQLKEELV